MLGYIRITISGYHHFQTDPVEVCCFRSWGAVGNSRIVRVHIVGFECTVILELDYGTFCRKALFISPLVDKSLFPVDFPTKKSMGEASMCRSKGLDLEESKAWSSLGIWLWNGPTHHFPCLWACDRMYHYDSLCTQLWSEMAVGICFGIDWNHLFHTQAISGRHVDISNIRTFERLIPHTSDFLLRHWLIAMNLPNRSNSWFGVSQFLSFCKAAMRCSQLGSKASNPTALSSNFVAGMWPGMQPSQKSATPTGHLEKLQLVHDDWWVIRL